MNDASAQLEELYRTHGPHLLRYLQRLAANQALAEDLLQETFIQALRHKKRLDRVSSPRAWLFAVARNLCMTAHRRAKPHAPLPDQMADEVAEEDQRLDPMRQAIGQLPPLQREALELRLRDELSYAEIANVLNVPLGTIRSRLHDAIRRLREKLTEE